MTLQSYFAGALLRLVLVATLVLQGMIAGALATRMTTAQVVAGPGDMVLICTPEGFKTVPWSDISDEHIPLDFGCACPCTSSCSSGSPCVPKFLVVAVDYNANCMAVARRDERTAAPSGSCGHSSIGARAPPSHSI
ncbi:MAG: hypothetical protein MPJ78_18310 [Hyphomicrobiaceae bacterium]|nr:hypothetical protein [Hyphomicrobiaceae bacterium]